MIKKIEIGKKYRNINNKVTMTYTALHIHEDVLFYFWESSTMSGHSCMSSGVFMDCVNEIPEAPEAPTHKEAPEEWFEVFFKVPTGDLVRATLLYKSKKHFLDAMEMNEERFESIKLRKVEL